MGNSTRGRRRIGRQKPKNLHEKWWKQRIARQKEIDASIAAKADEYLYDKPYEDNKKCAWPGPSPWRASRRTACWAWMKTMN